MKIEHVIIEEGIEKIKIESDGYIEYAFVEVARDELKEERVDEWIGECKERCLYVCVYTYSDGKSNYRYVVYECRETLFNDIVELVAKLAKHNKKVRVVTLLTHKTRLIFHDTLVKKLLDDNITYDLTVV